MTMPADMKEMLINAGLCPYWADGVHLFEVERVGTLLGLVITHANDRGLPTFKRCACTAVVKAR